MLLSFVAGIAAVCLSGACSKKGPTSSGEVKTETSSALKAIYFDFDQYNIRADQTGTLQANALWLKANPNVNTIIEGNCDDRGTNEYNMARREESQCRERIYFELGGHGQPHLYRELRGRASPLHGPKRDLLVAESTRRLRRSKIILPWQSSFESI
jgi:hypothetical protein